MAEQKVTIRIEATGADQAAKALQGIAASGAQVGSVVMGGAQQASRELGGLGAQLKDVGAAFQEGRGGAALFSIATTLATNPIVGMAAAAGAAVFALEKMRASLQANVDEVRRLAAVSGLSVEAADDLGNAFELAGSDTGALTTALFRMGTQIEAGAGGLTRFGITLHDSAGAMKTEGQLFLEVRDKISAIGDASTRNAALLALFGRAGRELAPIFALSREEFEKFLERGGQLSPLTQDMFNRSRQLTQAQNELKQAWQGLTNELADNGIPRHVAYLKVITDIVVKLREWAEASRAGALTQPVTRGGEVVLPPAPAGSFETGPTESETGPGAMTMAQLAAIPPELGAERKMLFSPAELATELGLIKQREQAWLQALSVMDAMTAASVASGELSTRRATELAIASAVEIRDTKVAAINDQIAIETKGATLPLEKGTEVFNKVAALEAERVAVVTESTTKIIGLNAKAYQEEIKDAANAAAFILGSLQHQSTAEIQAAEMAFAGQADRVDQLTNMRNAAAVLRAQTDADFAKKEVDLARGSLDEQEKAVLAYYAKLDVLGAAQVAQTEAFAAQRQQVTRDALAGERNAYEAASQQRQAIFDSALSAQQSALRIAVTRGEVTLEEAATREADLAIAASSQVLQRRLSDLDQERGAVERYYQDGTLRRDEYLNALGALDNQANKARIDSDLAVQNALQASAEKTAAIQQEAIAKTKDSLKFLKDIFGQIVNITVPAIVVNGRNVALEEIAPGLFQAPSTSAAGMVSGASLGRGPVFTDAQRLGTPLAPPAPAATVLSPWTWTGTGWVFNGPGGTPASGGASAAQAQADAQAAQAAAQEAAAMATFRAAVGVFDTAVASLNTDFARTAAASFSPEFAATVKAQLLDPLAEQERAILASGGPAADKSAALGLLSDHLRTVDQVIAEIATTVQGFATATRTAAASLPSDLLAAFTSARLAPIQARLDAIVASGDDAATKLRAVQDLERDQSALVALATTYDTISQEIADASGNLAILTASQTAAVTQTLASLEGAIDQAAGALRAQLAVGLADPTALASLTGTLHDALVARYKFEIEQIQAVEKRIGDVLSTFGDGLGQLRLNLAVTADLGAIRANAVTRILATPAGQYGPESPAAAAATLAPAVQKPVDNVQKLLDGYQHLADTSISTAAQLWAIQQALAAVGAMAQTVAGPGGLGRMAAAAQPFIDKLAEMAEQARSTGDIQTALSLLQREQQAIMGVAQAQLGVLQQQLGFAQYVDSLKFDQLSAQAQLTQRQAELDAAVKKAAATGLTTDALAAQQAAQALLQSGQSFYGNNTAALASLRQSIISELEQVGAAAGIGTTVDVQDAIDKLNSDMTATLTDLAGQQDALMTELLNANTSILATLPGTMAEIGAQQVDELKTVEALLAAILSGATLTPDQINAILAGGQGTKGTLPQQPPIDTGAPVLSLDTSGAPPPFTTTDLGSAPGDATTELLKTGTDAVAELQNIKDLLSAILAATPGAVPPVPSHAAGAWDTREGLAYLHPHEMVIPRDPSERIRAMALEQGWPQTPSGLVRLAEVPGASGTALSRREGARPSDPMPPPGLSQARQADGSSHGWTSQPASIAPKIASLVAGLPVLGGIAADIAPTPTGRAQLAALGLASSVIVSPALPGATAATFQAAWQRVATLYPAATDAVQSVRLLPAAATDPRAIAEWHGADRTMVLNAAYWSDARTMASADSASRQQGWTVTTSLPGEATVYHELGHALATSLARNPSLGSAERYASAHPVSGYARTGAPEAFAEMFAKIMTMPSAPEIAPLRAWLAAATRPAGSESVPQDERTGTEQGAVRAIFSAPVAMAPSAWFSDSSSALVEHTRTSTDLQLRELVLSREISDRVLAMASGNAPLLAGQWLPPGAPLAPPILSAHGGMALTQEGFYGLHLHDQEMAMVLPKDIATLVRDAAAHQGASRSDSGLYRLAPSPIAPAPPVPAGRGGDLQVHVTVNVAPGGAADDPRKLADMIAARVKEEVRKDTENSFRTGTIKTLLEDRLRDR